MRHIVQTLLLDVGGVGAQLVVANGDAVPVRRRELAAQTEVVEARHVAAARVARHVHGEVVHRGERHHSAGGGGGGVTW